MKNARMLSLSFFLSLSLSRFEGNTQWRRREDLIYLHLGIVLFLSLCPVFYIFLC